jgi:hypothetical protein
MVAHLRQQRQQSPLRLRRQRIRLQEDALCQTICISVDVSARKPDTMDDPQSTFTGGDNHYFGYKGWLLPSCPGLI